MFTVPRLPPPERCRRGEAPFLFRGPTPNHPNLHLFTGLGFSPPQTPLSRGAFFFRRLPSKLHDDAAANNNVIKAWTDVLMACRATDADSDQTRVALENNGRAMEKTRNMSGVPRRRWGAVGQRGGKERRTSQSLHQTAMPQQL